jgi:hypothetical protein
VLTDPPTDCGGLSWLCRCPACADDRASAPSPDAPSGFDPGLERRAEFVGILCRKVDLVGHSVESERNRSDVPRHDIAAQVADGRLDAKRSRVLCYKDIREAHHIMEADAGGK